MKKTIGLLVLVCAVAFAQERGGGRPAAVGGGHVGDRGPASTKASKPPRVSAHPAPSEPPAVAQNHIAADKKGHPELPHVDAKNDQWVGHKSGANDPHYQLDQPFEHGRFTGGFGPQHVFRLAGGNRDCFWFENGDQIVIYEDPDHIGWYLAYNPRLGTYAHVEYLEA